jgi:hypothetical protein
MGGSLVPCFQHGCGCGVPVGWLQSLIYSLFRYFGAFDFVFLSQGYGNDSGLRESHYCELWEG